MRLLEKKGRNFAIGEGLTSTICKNGLVELEKFEALVMVVVVVDLDERKSMASVSQTSSVNKPTW